MKIFVVTLCVATAVFIGLFLFTRWESAGLDKSFPPIGKYVQLNGFKLHYVEAGSGPAVVLIHGASTNLRDFTSSIFDNLSRDCRVVAFDRPGHGYSTYPRQYWMNPEQQAEAIRNALKQLGVERSVWLGHSWGGSVVMSALLKFPQEMAGGVLLGGAAYSWQGGVSWANHLPDIPVLGRLFTSFLLIPIGGFLMDNKIASVFLPNQPPPNYRQQTGVDLVLRASHFTVNGRDLRLLSDFLEQQSMSYSTIEQPLLMIHGTEDDIVPAWNHADRLAKLLPQAVLKQLPATGHAPHHVHAEEVAREVARFACS